MPLNQDIALMRSDWFANATRQENLLASLSLIIIESGHVGKLWAYHSSDYRFWVIRHYVIVYPTYVKNLQLYLNWGKRYNCLLHREGCEESFCMAHPIKQVSKYYLFKKHDCKSWRGEIRRNEGKRFDQVNAVKLQYALYLETRSLRIVWQNTKIASLE